ncbi:MAG: hypothetical protein AABZ06_14875 [Bdellovibrionota bacterium]
MNYWEFRQPAAAISGGSRRSSPIGEKLDQLFRSGIKHVTSFVPWHAVETDISHSLVRFLQAATERNMTVSLVLTPELGLHYPNSGLPKDLISDDCTARSNNGGKVVVNLPPNIFALPSFFSQHFNKRLHGYLVKMDSLLCDLDKTDPKISRNLSVVFSGGFWKYYNSAVPGPSGDFSPTASTAFRQEVERFFDDREFGNESPGTPKWKDLGLDSVNRRWFNQQAEEVFRGKVLHVFGRRAQTNQAGLARRTREVEIFTPEADPAFTYSKLLSELASGNPDAVRLSGLISAAATRCSSVAGSAYPPFFHWSSVGNWSSLPDSEKQFVLMKSFLLAAGRGGGVFMDEADWFSLPQAFRARMENLAELFTRGDIKIEHKAFYLSPHAWSACGPLWAELSRQNGFWSQVTADVEVAAHQTNARLVVVDPEYVFTRETVEKLSVLARRGLTVAIPKSHLFSAQARKELEYVTSQAPRIDITLGLHYKLYVVGEGKIVIYETQRDLLKADSAGVVKFIKDMLAVSEICEQVCVSDRSLTVVPAKLSSGDTAIFVLNESRRAVSGNIVFPRVVEVSDFADIFSSAVPVVPATIDSKTKGATAFSSRFSVEVGAFGILSLLLKEIKKTVRAAPQKSHELHL